MNPHLKFNMFMFQNHTKQAALWGETIEPHLSKDLGYRFKIAHTANKNLQVIFDKALGPLEDESYQDSLVISDCMELIRKEKDVQKKQHLYIIMKEYSEGTLKIIEDDVSVSLHTAMNEIENAMERWHHARDEDGETLQKINNILVKIGRLKWFNKQ